MAMWRINATLPMHAFANLGSLTLGDTRGMQPAAAAMLAAPHLHHQHHQHPHGVAVAAAVAGGASGRSTPLLGTSPASPKMGAGMAAAAAALAAAAAREHEVAPAGVADVEGSAGGGDDVVGIGRVGSGGSGAPSGFMSGGGQQPSYKKQRVPGLGDGGAGAGGPAGAGGAKSSGAVTTVGGLSIRVNVFQQQRGQFEVTASVPNSAGPTEAGKFTALMGRVQQDLEALWK